MDGLGSKWTGLGVKLDRPNDLKWTVVDKSGLSSGMKVDGPKRSNGFSMFVADFIDEVCWWQIGDVGDKSG